MSLLHSASIRDVQLYPLSLPNAVLNIALIIGSTRPNRFADVPAAFIQEGAAERSDFVLETLDLREYAIPYYEEAILPPYRGGSYTNEAAEAWRNKIGEFDAFIVTVAEYNHGPTAVLKNALDSAVREWNRKPIAFIGYGGVGGARAIEQLRGIVIELQMAPIKAEVNVTREPLMGVMTQGRTLSDFDYLVTARGVMFDQLVWWANALKVARENSAM